MARVNPCAPNPVSPPSGWTPGWPGWDVDEPETVDDLLQLIDIGESVAVGAAAGSAGDEEEEEEEPCRRIYLHAFRGDRSDEGMREFKQSLADNKARGASGPTAVECLLYTGHVGISFNAMSPVFGFNPNTGTTPGWEVIESLKSKDKPQEPYPGYITDDTAAFVQARSRGLEYRTVEYIYPKSKYDEIREKFKAARKSTGLTYSFPGQGGDCNCATWPARIGIPIPSQNGAMRAYMATIGRNDVRQQGACKDE